MQDHSWFQVGLLGDEGDIFRCEVAIRHSSEHGLLEADIDGLRELGHGTYDHKIS